MTDEIYLPEAPADMVQAFYRGAMTVGFASREHGPVFALCDRDPTFPTRVLRFFRVGRRGQVTAVPCPEHKAAEYLRCLLFVPKPTP